VAAGRRRRRRRERVTEDAALRHAAALELVRRREAITTFLAGWPLFGDWRWLPLWARANGQPGFAVFYTSDAEAEAYLPFALNVVTLCAKLISDVTASARSTELPGAQRYARWPEQPADRERLLATFERFRLASRLD
jgi:hypothetical protein